MLRNKFYGHPGILVTLSLAQNFICQLYKIMLLNINPLDFYITPSRVEQINEIDCGMRWAAGCEGAATPAVQVKGAKTTLAGLPMLPANARYVLHVNECFDWGTYAVCSVYLPQKRNPISHSVHCRSALGVRAGYQRLGGRVWRTHPCPGWQLAMRCEAYMLLTVQWALNATTAVVDSTKYKYIMFINSSVRGPFLPSYWPVRSPSYGSFSQLCLPYNWRHSQAPISKPICRRLPDT